MSELITVGLNDIRVTALDGGYVIERRVRDSVEPISNARLTAEELKDLRWCAARMLLGPDAR